MLFRYRPPVKREGAERYLLITLVSFAASVVLTRVTLELAGYPQLGGDVLHIAHVLWGGLLLFVAALLPVAIANRWVYTLGALLGGIGTGLFIDEVGKFITQNNDYFFPFAAPIIYAFFLLTVLLYLQIRRPSKHDSRTELYHALDQIMELIENDLDEAERNDLEARLTRVIAEATIPEHTRLAEALLAVLNSDTLTLITPVPNALERVAKRLTTVEERLLTERRLRLGLILGLAFASLGSVITLGIATIALVIPDQLEPFVASLLYDSTLINNSTSVLWFLVLLALNGLTGLMMVVGGALLFIGQTRRGSEISFLGLVVSLTMVNLLLFYFNQFAALGTTLWEFTLLVALLRYRQIYLDLGTKIDVLSTLARPQESQVE
jgi:hypothetical protein